MNTIITAAAAVTGARHLRMARNGQDAAGAWAREDAAAIVVCDGCGSGASSEVGARLGAKLVLGALARRLAAGQGAADPALWADMRRDVVATLAALAVALPGDRAQAVHDHLLFTVVAAATCREGTAMWAIGDGAYRLGDRWCELGPFADNRPPYLAYDLLGDATEAHLEVRAGRTTTMMVATDGIAELGLDVIAVDPALRHPDALRRQLSLLARGTEAIDWDNRRVVRTPARLQDDGAVAIARWL